MATKKLFSSLRHSSKKRKLMLVLFFIVVLFLGIGGYLKYVRDRGDDVSYVPGEISAVAKDGTTVDQVYQLIEELGLAKFNVKLSEELFTPTEWRGIKKTEYQGVRDKLLSYPLVVSVIDDSANPSNNRAAGDEYWIKMVFKQNATNQDIKDILIIVGIGQSWQTNYSTKDFYLTVPAGQEDNSVKKLKKSPIIDHAERVQAGVLIYD